MTNLSPKSQAIYFEVMRLARFYPHEFGSARLGLGHEDIRIRLNLPESERNNIRDMVLNWRKKG